LNLGGLAESVNLPTRSTASNKAVQTPGGFEWMLVDWVSLEFVDSFQLSLTKHPAA